MPMMIARPFVSPLGLALIIALSAGCGSQSEPNVSSSSQLLATPLAAGQDLLYVAGGKEFGPGRLTLYTFPQGQRRKTVTGEPFIAGGECADGSGNVYVISNSATSPGSSIYVYAHGKTKPTRTINGNSSNYSDFTGCAADPTSGDLAVRLAETSVLIYPNATGTPSLYKFPPHVLASGCTYDDSGDLFVAGAWLGTKVKKRYPLRLLELPLGQSTFISVGLPHIHWPSTTPGELRWDGKNLAFVNGADSIYRLAVSGSEARIVGVTKLDDAPYIGGFWVQGGALVAVANHSDKIWNYPAGGKPTATIRSDWGAVTVSVPTSH
jgi:hypothetical protein